MNYRNDIDGLRAIAVIAVILFHGNVKGFSGGYAGVDVFFVISGFLITGIILSKIDAGKFSLGDFYVRRMRRLLPAVLAMVLVVLVAGAFLLFPGNYKDLAKSAVAAVLSIANIYFWQDSGYFAHASDLKPLLHTWSLGVEEQFYMVYPLFLLIFCKVVRRGRGWVLTGLMLAGVAISWWVTPRMPSAAFYLLPTRAWQLLLGGAALLWASGREFKPWLRHVATSTGLVMTLVSIFVFDASAEFPGRDALLPCCGATLMLMFAKGSFLDPVLSAKPMTWIGKVSYSLYLWHWPLVVYMRHALGEITWPWTLAYFVITFVLGYLSWKYIEQPLRFWKPKARYIRVATASLAASLSVGLLALVIIVGEGWKGRFGASAEAYAMAAHEPYCVVNIRKAADAQVYGTSDVAPRYAAWGDSHVMALGGMLTDLAAAQGESIVIYTRPSTPPVMGIRRSGPVDISHYNRAVFNDIVSRDIETVFLHASWTGYYQREKKFCASSVSGELGDSHNVSISSHIEITVNKLRKEGCRVVLISPIPIPKVDVPRLLARAARRGKQMSPVLTPKDYESNNEEFFTLANKLQKLQGVEVIYVSQTFEGPGGYLLQKEGVSLYRDTDHLSETGAKLIAPLLAPYFQSDRLIGESTNKPR